jgi:hypothetical protein
LIIHQIFAGGREERIKRPSENLQRLFGIFNRLQSKRSDTQRGLDLVHHQEVAYDIPGPLETPRVFKERIDGLFMQYVTLEERDRVTGSDFIPSILQAKNCFGFEEAAASRNISDELNTQQRASSVAFSAPLRSWLEDARSIVQRYFKLYGNIIAPNDLSLEGIPYVDNSNGQPIINAEELVKKFEQSIENLERYIFEKRNNRKDFFNNAMKEVIQQLNTIKLIAIYHDEATRQTVREISPMSAQINQLQQEVEQLKNKINSNGSQQ